MKSERFTYASFFLDLSSGVMEGRENGHVGCMCDPHLRGGSRGGVPQASCGRLGGSVSALPFGNARGFVCCFDTVCIKGGVLLWWGGCDKKSKNDILRSISINTNRVVTANLSRSQDKPALIRTVTGPILVVFQGFI